MNTTENAANIAAALRAAAVAVDSVLLPLQGRLHSLNGAVADARVAIKKTTSAARAARLEESARLWTMEAEALQAEIQTLQDVARAGRWARFIYVPGGHVHRRSCSTVRWTTETVMLADYSGSSDAEVIAAAGESACTVCFPDAPVAARPSTIPAVAAEREAKAATAAAKTDKAAAARALAITDENGRVVFKTQRGAENELGQILKTLAYYATYHAQLFDGRNWIPNTISHEDYMGPERTGRLYNPERRAAATIKALLVSNGVDAAAVKATADKKWAAAVKEMTKDGAGVIPEDFTY